MLGKVPAGLELYREVTGDKEDKPIENGPEIVHLKEDEHFHSGPPKTYTIYVNGQKKVVTTKTVTFDQIVEACVPDASDRAEHPVHDRLRGRSARQPARLAERGRNRQGEGRDDLQCHSD